MDRRLCALLGILLLVVNGCSNCTLRMNGCMTAKTYTYTPKDNTAPRMGVVALPPQTPYCNGYKIALIDVDGLLFNRNYTGIDSMGENPVGLFREKLEAATRDPNIRAVVLRINSPGGGVTASDIMRRDLVQFKRITGLPVIACLMDVGAGGGYYLATAADHIVALPTSVTGGIGCVFNVYSLTSAMQEQGVFPAVVRSGERIDMGSPVSQTDERVEVVEQSAEMLEKMAQEFHNRFREVVERSRPHLHMKEEDWDGRVFTATQAREKGLIDDIAYLDDAIAMAQNVSGTGPGARTVMFRRCNDRAYSQYEITPNIPATSSGMPLSIPGLDRARMPMFLYLWQPEPSLEKIGRQY